MALDLSDQGHIDLQSYFMRWAPGVPPLDVRLRALGLNKIPSFSMILDGEDTSDWSSQVKHSEAVAALDDPRAPSPTWTEQYTWSVSSRSSSDGSNWSWSEDDELADEERPVSPNNDNDLQERSVLPDQTEYSLGDAPAFPPGLDFVPGITSVFDALDKVRGIRFLEEVDPVIEGIARWTQSLNSACSTVHPELQHFRNKCETYPLLVWGLKKSLKLPQLDYADLLDILSEMPDDEDTEEKESLITLANGHLFGIVWAKLFLRGILTRRIFDAGCYHLWANKDVARLSILETTLTEVLDAPSEAVDGLDEEDNLEQLLLDACKVKERLKERRRART